MNLTFWEHLVNAAVKITFAHARISQMVRQNQQALKHELNRYKQVPNPQEKFAEQVKIVNDTVADLKLNLYWCPGCQLPLANVILEEDEKTYSCDECGSTVTAL